MTIKIQQEDQSFIWVSIEEVNMYSESKKVIEHTGEYVCYYKFPEKPTIAVSGELLKDKNNKLFKIKR